MRAAASPEISVVVPVFNGARFVLASVASVLDHTRAGIELICVDDGSTDDSARLLDELALEDPRVSVIRLARNGGASTARNAGIERANGEFVFFLDADDSVPPGALDLLLSAARSTGSELAIGQLSWLRTEDERSRPFDAPTGGEIVTTVLRDSPFLQSVPGCHCCNLYGRGLLDRSGIRYPTDLTYGEDQLFQATAIAEAAKVAIVRDVVYVYHHYRSESLTRQPPSLRNLVDDIEFHARVAQLFYRHGLADAAQRFLSFWSYSIREYWLQIPAVLSRDDAAALFAAFRKMVEEFGVTPWTDRTPEPHRRILGLVLAGQDEQVISLLADIRLKENSG